MAALVSAASPGCTAQAENPHRPETGLRMAPARDGDVAIAQELDAARRRGTVEAYDLFLARHPRHPFARKAREERKKLID